MSPPFCSHCASSSLWSIVVETKFLVGSPPCLLYEASEFAWGLAQLHHNAVHVVLETLLGLFSL